MSITNSFRQLKEITRLKQALSENPKNTDALLKLAMLMGTLKEPDLDGQRKLLNTILSIEPSHQKAREMLLEIDPFETSGIYSQTASPLVSETQASGLVVNHSSNDEFDKPRVFRYSPLFRFMLYTFIFMTLCSGIITFQDPRPFTFVLILILMLLPTAWSTTAVVEISSWGVKSHHLLGTSKREIAWKDVATIKSNVMTQGIKLISNEGASVVLSSQLVGYPVIMEYLFKIRDDLFSSNAESWTKTFRGRFLFKYALFFLAVVTSLILIGTVFAVQCFPAVILAIISFFLWGGALTNPHTVKLEGNKLITRSFRKQQEWRANQIKNIHIITQRNYRGRATAFLEVQPLEGLAFNLVGFPEGKEMMYGFLKKWWATHQNG